MFTYSKPEPYISERSTTFYNVNIPSSTTGLVLFLDDEFLCSSFLRAKPKELWLLFESRWLGEKRSGFHRYRARKHIFVYTHIDTDGAMG